MYKGREECEGGGDNMLPARYDVAKHVKKGNMHLQRSIDTFPLLPTRHKLMCCRVVVSLLISLSLSPNLPPPEKRKKSRSQAGHTARSLPAVCSFDSRSIYVQTSEADTANSTLSAKRKRVWLCFWSIQYACHTSLFSFVLFFLATPILDTPTEYMHNAQLFGAQGSSDLPAEGDTHGMIPSFCSLQRSTASFTNYLPFKSNVAHSLTNSSIH